MSPSFTAEISLPKATPDGNFRAYAKLIVDGIVVVDGFRVMDGKFGLFVAPPSEKSTKLDDQGKPVWFDKVRFIEDVPEGKRKGAYADAAEKAILDAYKSATSSGAGASRPDPTNVRPASPASSAPMW